MSKQNFQQQMGSLTHEFQERFHNEQQAEWDKLPFTSTAINESFAKYREFGLMYETPISMGLSPKYFIHLMTGEMTDYFVSDIVSLCQAFERRTMHQYMSITGARKESRQEFADFLAVAEQITTEINAIVEPIKDRLVRKMQSLQAAGVSAKSNKTIALS